MEEEGDSPFPWEAVEASRTNDRLQSRAPVEQGKKAYLSRASACPECQIPADCLGWFYFVSPDWIWEHLCGRAGGLVICDRYHKQVNFFCEIMN